MHSPTEQVSARSAPWVFGLLLAMAGIAGVYQTGLLGSFGPRASHSTIIQTIEIEHIGSARYLRVGDARVEELLDAGGRPLPQGVVGRIETTAAEVRLPDGAPLPAPEIRQQWPAIYATARFDGEAVVVAFDDPINRYRITLDDGAGPVLTVTQPGRRALELSGLGPGRHSLRLDKISESSGPSGFARFFVPEGGVPLPPPPPRQRQIEIIGDSDSVGYGDTSGSRDCEDRFPLTDTQQSYGPRVASHFDADYQLIASSGIGLVRNSGDMGGDWTMSRLYPRVLFQDPVPFGWGGWDPHVVVLALGSNDFDSPPGPGRPPLDLAGLRARFEARYLRFLHDLRAREPDAFFLLLAWEEYGPDYLAAHEAVLGRLRAEGEARVGLLRLPEMEKTGCDWHPSLEDHRRVAEAIIRYIETRPGLWRD